MKIKQLLFVGLAALMLACNGKKQAPQEIAATYYGIIPCADCPGIYLELQLKKDFTYSEKRFYLESQTDTMLSKGNFEIKNDSVIVLKNSAAESSPRKWKYANGQLKMLDAAGEEITSEMAELYILKTEKPKKLYASRAKAENLSYFKATGNEPFWALEIKADKMVFTTPDSLKISASVPQAVKTENGKDYTAKSESGSMEISILNKDCQDDMSGERFSHMVSVTFKTPEMQETKTYTGCGGYMNQKNTMEIAKKIDGKWILKEIDGEKVEVKNFKTPTMEIHLVEGKIMGVGGCNQYSGKIKILEENYLSTSMLISTKMACPGLELEGRFMKAISAKKLEFERKEDHLILKNDLTSLVFKKAK